MCGIAGIAGRECSTLSSALLERMGDVIAHRGPDDSGIWISPQRTPAVGLVHRRLSIIDLSAAGHQPMTNEDASLWVTYNGEIYNHQDIRAELEAAGHQYRSRSDTETIVHAYEQWGDDCVQRFRGMFAFGLWDGKRRRLLLVRDRLGVKPLYYARLPDGGLVFGSEIKAILASGLVRPVASRAALPEYLLFGYLAGEQTMFEGISTLPPGHMLVWDESGVQVRPYWTLQFRAQAGASEQELSDRFGQVFDEAVRLRLLSDVPLGVFLSGGLDSSAIAAVMNRHVGERLSTFSIGFPAGHYSELPYARMVAEHLGADHHEVVLTADDFINSLPRMVWHEDEPIWTIASVAMYHVSRLAAQHVKVVLSGEGSDELFAGYDRYWFGVMNQRFAGPYGHVPAPLRRGVRWLLSQRALPERARRALSHTFLCREGTPEALHFDNWFGIFTPEQQQAFCTSEAAAAARDADVYAAHLEHFRSSGSDDPLDKMLYVDIKTNLVELLMKQDQMSMATSIESRVPFLDHRLVEFAATIPSSAKLGRFSGKRLVKHAVRDLLPDAIINRRKQGFPVPFDAWLRQDFAGHVQALLLSDAALGRGWFKPDAMRHLVRAHASGAANASRQLWALLTLELWARIFLDGDTEWVDAPRDAWSRVRAEPSRPGFAHGRPAAARAGSVDPRAPVAARAKAHD
jgi:asparagine synthase (glutamine-hydrolysing)